MESYEHACTYGFYNKKSVHQMNEKTQGLQCFKLTISTKRNRFKETLRKLKSLFKTPIAFLR